MTDEPSFGTIPTDYEKKNKGYADAAGWDLQKVDLGIALYHFAFAFDEKVQMSINAPGLSAPDDVEYIATLIAD